MPQDKNKYQSAPASSTRVGISPNGYGLYADQLMTATNQPDNYLVSGNITNSEQALLNLLRELLVKQQRYPTEMPDIKSEIIPHPSAAGLYKSYQYNKYYGLLDKSSIALYPAARNSPPATLAHEYGHHMQSVMPNKTVEDIRSSLPQRFDSSNYNWGVRNNEMMADYLGQALLSILHGDNSYGYTPANRLTGGKMKPVESIDAINDLMKLLGDRNKYFQMIDKQRGM